MSASAEYEKAKAEAVAQVVQDYRRLVARQVARDLFGGTAEQQEETYQKLMESRGSSPD